MKANTYSLMRNVGKVRYLVNFCTGKSFYSDGSLFVDIRCFSNKKKANAFISELVAEGYAFNGVY